MGTPDKTFVSALYPPVTEMTVPLVYVEVPFLYTKYVWF